MKMSAYFFLILLMPLLLKATELLKNPDFENTSLDGWKGRKCKIQLSQDAHSGNQSAYISERETNFAGIEQMVDVEQDTRYVVRAFIKLTNHKANYSYHTVKIIIQYKNSENKTKNDHMAVQPWLQKDFGWTEIGADYRTKPGVTKIKMYIRIEEPEVNYLFDSASITKLEDNNNWEKEANDYIKTSRKSDIILKTPKFYREKNFTIKIEQIKSEFPFGCLVRLREIVDPDPKYKKYQDFYFNNFEWATIGNGIKWKQTEKSQGVLTFDDAWKGIEILTEKGFPIRGHNIFWATKSHVPSWVYNVTNLLEVLKKRVKDVIQNTTGRITHWDVDNEALHGDYFEQRLNNANLSMDMFKWVNDAEPDAKLFLNDFSVVNRPTSTTAYKNQGTLFANAGVPIYGVGVQGHFKSGNVDMTALKYRLDKVAEAGLPIWLSELTILEPDENVKATALKNILTMFFGHPSVEGIIIYDFWNQTMSEENQDNALATGDDVTPNAAGIQYQTLRGKTWRTNESLAPTRFKTVVRAFQGEYKISIIGNGEEKLTTTLTLGKESKTVRIIRDGDNADGINFRIS